jgi:hypothetical protein
MDKYNNVVIKEKSSRTNIIIITVAIIILILGAIGIWWFSDQNSDEIVPELETMSNIEEEFDSADDFAYRESAISYNGVQNRTALELLKELFPDRVVVELNADGVEVLQSIDGITSDDNRRWELFVNGVFFEKDPNLFITTDADVLEWRLNELHEAVQIEFVE